jgi:cysteine desulfurase
MIYLDYAATTPCDPEVVDAMLPFLRDQFGNASSIDHVFGARAQEAVEHARRHVADLVGAQPEDIIFTSGATEANNLALSVELPVRTTRVEHPSVLDAFEARQGEFDSYIPTDRDGLVHRNVVEAAASERRSLISVVATNNETGTEQDLDVVAEAVGKTNSLLHVDGTQAVGTQAIDLRKRGIHGCSISAHKIYGPKGIGALTATHELRRELRPILLGGGHERGFRSGTSNVPAIVGFGVAAQLAARHRSQRRKCLTSLQERFLEVLYEASDKRAIKTIEHARTSPHILSVRILGINGRALVRSVRDEVAFSLGSACATNKAEPSHILLALGLEKQQIAETIRCSFSVEQTMDEVERAGVLIGTASKALADYSVPA